MSFTVNDINHKLVPFLKELIESIESNQLSEEQLKHIGEFFMSYRFYENSNENSNETDIVKFITMGWYIYTQLLKDEENIIPD
jgi:hypothetical protein